MLTHEADGPCLVCGHMWHAHLGHVCMHGAHAGGRGSWREDGALGALAVHHPGIADEDDDPDAVRMADLPLGL